MIDGIHPDTERAFNHIDAAMFTGDPGETREKFEFFKKMIDRWKRKMDEVEKDPWYLESERLEREGISDEEDED